MPAAITCVMMDIVKSCTIQKRLKANVGDKVDRTYTNEIYTPCRRRFLDLLGNHKGNLHDDVGDQLAAYFDYTQDALKFAIDFQRAMRETPIAVPEEVGCPHLQLRAAIGFGTMEDESYQHPGEYRVSSYSDLARVLAVAWPEQILMTDDCSKRAGTVPGIALHRWQDIVLPKESEKITLLEVIWNDTNPRRPNSPSWKDEALKAWVYQTDHCMEAHCGAFLWSPFVSAVFSNRPWTEIEDVRKSLQDRRFKELAAHESDESCEWTILVESEQARELHECAWEHYQGEGIKEYQKKIAWTRLWTHWDSPVIKESGHSR